MTHLNLALMLMILKVELVFHQHVVYGWSSSFTILNYKYLNHCRYQILLNLKKTPLYELLASTLLHHYILQNLPSHNHHFDDAFF